MYYAQINSDNIVIAVSDLSGIIDKTHPMYDTAIPIREYDASLMSKYTDTEIVTHRYIEKDLDGYGLFDEVREEIQSENQSESEEANT